MATKKWQQLLLLGSGVGGLLALGILTWRLSRPQALSYGHKPTSGTAALTTPFTAPVQRGYIVLDGQRIPTTFPVNHSRSFPAGQSGTGYRNQPLVGGVLHWTAAENPGNRVFSTLSHRGISVHFAMDRDGTVWQFADPARVYTTNAGRTLGQRTWAIEIANYGMAAPGNIPEAGRDRPTYQAEIHGRLRTVADFYPIQYRNLIELANLIHDHLRLPKEVVTQPVAFVPWSRLRNARGILAHYHASDDKKDPGPRLLEVLSGQPGWRAVSI